ncbi:MAG: exo-alpha-sialidase [Candidatus Lokiarchaeota archaeon]|nr:exo-alpha-sialidase [Candidatus Lokiarchaeota archaeon]MBD3342465.1 exo-alpha-sialidase [Candidatus Lokiarchaeota archaeon]
MNEPFLEKVDVYKARMHGFFTYRIPTLVYTQRGSLLAFAEARKGSTSDWAGMSLVMRRSEDQGKTWGPIKEIDTSDKEPVHNPVAIIPHDSNKIHFLYCRNYNQAFYMESEDDGITFSEPKEITETFEEFKPDFKFRVFATGPGHGIQLDNGRLIVPVWLAKRHIHRPSVASVIYSDDKGTTWHRSEVILGPLVNAGETIAIQLANGDVLLNIRNEAEISRRAFSISKNGATGWSYPEFDEALVEPVCFASIIRLTKKGKEDKNRILFVNPNSIEGEPTKVFNLRPRKNLTVKVSYDECKTWLKSKTIEPGSSGYADLAVGKDYTIYCLYEYNCPIDKDFDTEAMKLAKFNLQWITDKKDSIEL